MQNLKIAITVNRDGNEEAVGFSCDAPTTKDEFIERASLLVMSIARKLEMDRAFI